MSGACLVLGAGGRVGRSLRAVWDEATDGAPVLFQSRQAGPGIAVVGDPGRGLVPQIGRPIATVAVLAGVTAARTAEGFAANTRLARAGWDLALALGTPRLVVCSTAAVYPGGSHVWHEDDEIAPRNAYAISKRAMEVAAAGWVAEAAGAGPAVLCLRLANVVGADMLANAVARSSPTAPLKLHRFDDGRSPRRAYLAPSTLAKVLAAPTPAPARFTLMNLAEAGPSIEMAALLDARVSLGHPLAWEWIPAPAEALPNLEMDVTRAETAYSDALVGPTDTRSLAADWLAAEAPVA